MDLFGVLERADAGTFVVVFTDCVLTFVQRFFLTFDVCAVDNVCLMMLRVNEKGAFFGLKRFLSQLG